MQRAAVLLEANTQALRSRSSIGSRAPPRRELTSSPQALSAPSPAAGEERQRSETCYPIAGSSTSSSTAAFKVREQLQREWGYALLVLRLRDNKASA